MTLACYPHRTTIEAINVDADLRACCYGQRFAWNFIQAPSKTFCVPMPTMGDLSPRTGRGLPTASLYNTYCLRIHLPVLGEFPYLIKSAFHVVGRDSINTISPPLKAYRGRRVHLYVQPSSCLAIPATAANTPFEFLLIPIDLKDDARRSQRLMDPVVKDLNFPPDGIVITGSSRSEHLLHHKMLYKRLSQNRLITDPLLSGSSGCCRLASSVIMLAQTTKGLQNVE